MQMVRITLLAISPRQRSSPRCWKARNHAQTFFSSFFNRSHGRKIQIYFVFPAYFFSACVCVWLSVEFCVCFALQASSLLFRRINTEREEWRKDFTKNVHSGEDLSWGPQISAHSRELLARWQADKTFLYLLQSLKLPRSTYLSLKNTAASLLSLAHYTKAR